MTTETTFTTITTNNAGPSPAPREAHQSACFDLQLPLQIELANPWTVTDQELREIAEQPDCSPEAAAYIHGFMSARHGSEAPELLAMEAGFRAGRVVCQMTTR